MLTATTSTAAVPAHNRVDQDQSCTDAGEGNDMIARARVTVTNPSGLHARPAAELARLAGAVTSAVWLKVGDRTVDASSVLSVMASGVKSGQAVVVECEGDEAEADLAAVVAAIESGLGELVP